ncbi:Autolysin [Apiospora saccharicola]
MGLPLSHTWTGMPFCQVDSSYEALLLVGHTQTTTAPPERGCTAVARKNDIVLDQFLARNLGADGTSCSGLWPNTYACVSVVDHNPLSPSNGVQTPAPIQDGIMGTCKRFHFLQENQTCRTVAALYKISEGDFMKYNPAVGSDCRGGVG